MLTNSPITYVIVNVNDLRNSRTFYERRLALRVLDEDRVSVMYDAGQVTLCLQQNAKHANTRAGARDDTANITFLVDRMHGVRSNLEKRGIEFAEFFSYEVGDIADFYDPDGHWISLYEPSAEALTWPGGEKIRRALSTTEEGAQSPNTSAGRSPSPSKRAVENVGLPGMPLIYLFLFVGDADEAFDFYHHVLGLRVLESRACRRGSTSHGKGVVKYDAGPLLLTTHHVHGCRPISVQDGETPAGGGDSLGTNGISPVFCVDGLEHVREDLSHRGVRFIGEPITSKTGSVVQFEDPFGHVLHLYEPRPTQADNRP